MISLIDPWKRDSNMQLFKHNKSTAEAYLINMRWKKEAKLKKICCNSIWLS